MARAESFSGPTASASVNREDQREIALEFNVFTDRDVADLVDITRDWLRRVFPPGSAYYPTETALPDLHGLPTGVIEVSLNSNSCSFEAGAKGFDLSKTDFRISVQRMYGDIDTAAKAEIEDQLSTGSDELVMRIDVELLPSRRLMTAWNELIFEPAIDRQILVSLERTGYAVHEPQAAENGPISGQKSQQNVQRNGALVWPSWVSAQFPRAVLLEIDSHSMHSKYFGESARLVQETFDRIASLLERPQPPLVCVLIDEVESLAASRENSNGAGSEPKDAMRALNALLTAIDRMRDHHSLLVFCTSNMVVSMDRAFLDRFDFKWYIPEPSPPARYEILRRKYLQLLTTNVIIDGDEESDPAAGEGPRSRWENRLVRGAALPTYQSLVLHVEDPSYGLARQLEKCAQLAKNVSGRVLCKLPWTSLVFHTSKETTTLAEAIDALEASLHSEVLAQAAIESGNSGAVTNNGSTYI